MQRMLKEVLTIRWKRKTLLHLVKDDTGLFLGDYLITENVGSWVTHFTVNWFYWFLVKDRQIGRQLFSYLDQIQLQRKFMIVR